MSDTDIRKTQKDLQISDATLEWFAAESKKAIEELYYFDSLLKEDPEIDEDGVITDALEYSKTNLLYLAKKGEYEIKRRKEYQNKLNKELIQTVFNEKN